MSRKEKSASSMGQPIKLAAIKLAAMKDAPTKRGMEGSVQDIGQSELPELAVTKDAQTKSSMEVFARDTGQPVKLGAVKDAPTN